MWTRVAGARAASRPWSSVSSIGFSSRGGPGSRTSTCAPTSTHWPGRGAVAVVEHDAVLDDQRLPPVDRRHRHAARGEARLELGDDRRALDQRPADHARHGLARHVVVGRAEAAGQDDEVGARQRVGDRCGPARRRDRRRCAWRRRGCRAPARPSVTVSELVSRRGGISSSLPTATISAVVSGAQRHGHRLTATPGSAQSRPRMIDVAPHAGEDVVAHHAEAAGQALGAAGRKRLDDVADAEDEEADQPAGPRQRQEQRRDQHADHFVDHDRAGIDAAEVRLGGRWPPTRRRRTAATSAAPSAHHGAPT